MKINHLRHKHGGIIRNIHYIGHEIVKGVADWYFVGDVDWDDGTKSNKLQIAPWAVCRIEDTVDAVTECNAVFERMSEYLTKKGNWHDTKKKRDGRIYNWTPDSPTGEFHI